MCRKFKKETNKFGLVLVSLFVCNSLLAEPVVNGNTILVPDDGWYQVQSSDGLISICNGLRSCEVSPGMYIVINHDTDERFENVQVPANNPTDEPPLNVVPNETIIADNISIDQNVITFLTDDWYQVQSSNGLESLCNGEPTCVVEPGSYIIINHSTGQRFENINIGNNNNDIMDIDQTASLQDNFTVANSGIVFLDNDWYQVQTSDGLLNLCSGESTCELNPGSYIVINHTTRERFENIQVGDGNIVGGEVIENISTDDLPSNISVLGNKIHFLDGNFYQVTSVDGLLTLCSGTLSCEVEPGEYVIINQTDPERFTVFVEEQVEEQFISVEDAPTLIEIASASEFLADTVSKLRLLLLDSFAITGIPERTENFLPLSVGFGTFIPIGMATLTNGVDITFNRSRDCTRGGRQYVLNTVETQFRPRTTTQYFDRCQIDGYIIDGRVRVNDEFRGRDPDTSYTLSIKKDQTVLNVSGFLVLRDNAQEREFVATRFEVLNPNSNYALDNLVATFTRVDDQERSVSLRSSFILSNINSTDVFYFGSTTDNLIYANDTKNVVSGGIRVVGDGREVDIDSASGDADLYQVTLTELNGAVVSVQQPWSDVRLPDFNGLIGETGIITRILMRRQQPISLEQANCAGTEPVPGSSFAAIADNENLSLFRLFLESPDFGLFCSNLNNPDNEWTIFAPDNENVANYTGDMFRFLRDHIVTSASLSTINELAEADATGDTGGFGLTNAFGERIIIDLNTETAAGIPIISSIATNSGAVHLIQGVFDFNR